MSQPYNIIDANMIEQLKELLEDRFGELVERFISDGSLRVERLKAAVPKCDFAVIHAEAHGLKGSSRNIGANPLGQACEELENRGRFNNDEDLVTLLAAVEQEFAAVCTVLVKF